MLHFLNRLCKERAFDPMDADSNPPLALPALPQIIP